VGDRSSIQAAAVVMKAARLFCRWQRRLGELLGQLEALHAQCLVEGGVEAIHEFRVSLRRVRLLLRLGRPLLDPAATAEFRQWAKQVAEASGRVRDLDVAKECLAGRRGGARELQGLDLRRAREWCACAQALPAVPRTLASGLEQLESGRKSAERVRKRYDKLTRKLREVVSEQGPGVLELAPPARHELRRRVRWWRYLLELELSRRAQKHSALLQCLVRVQGALGEHQNLGIALELLERHPADPQREALQRGLAEAQAKCLREAHCGVKALARFEGWPRLVARVLPQSRAFARGRVPPTT
jgi:CHAD domain-containing protein